jgi:hypothetical protein
MRKTLENVLNFSPLKHINQLVKNNYMYLIVLLGTLSPESIWAFFRLE